MRGVAPESTILSKSILVARGLLLVALAVCVAAAVSVRAELPAARLLADMQLGRLAFAAGLGSAQPGNLGDPAAGNRLSVTLVEADQSLAGVYRTAIAQHPDFELDPNSAAIVSFETWQGSNIVAARASLWRKGWNLHAPHTDALVLAPWLIPATAIFALGLASFRRCRRFALIAGGLASFAIASVLSLLTAPIFNYTRGPALAWEHLVTRVFRVSEQGHISDYVLGGIALLCLVIAVLQMARRTPLTAETPRRIVSLTTTSLSSAVALLGWMAGAAMTGWPELELGWSSLPIWGALFGAALALVPTLRPAARVPTPSGPTGPD